MRHIYTAVIFFRCSSPENNQILFVADINRKVILMKNLIFVLRISHGSGSSEYSWRWYYEVLYLVYRLV